jgi:hypothetical protein
MRQAQSMRRPRKERRPRNPPSPILPLHRRVDLVGMIQTFLTSLLTCSRTRMMSAPFTARLRAAPLRRTTITA